MIKLIKLWLIKRTFNRRVKFKSDKINMLNDKLKKMGKVPEPEGEEESGGFKIAMNTFFSKVINKISGRG